MKMNLSKSVSSTKRLEEMLEEAEKELALIQPEIERLEKMQDKLKALKLTKQKLITLKLSVKSILENFSLTKDKSILNTLMVDESQEKLSNLSLKKETKNLTFSQETLEIQNKVFLPELAFEEVAPLLKQKGSLNYEIFRCVAFHGGQATTEQIKAYLVEHQIKQPSTGEGFEQVPLTDISSRINYLVRKGIVTPAGRGLFVSNIGWQEPEMMES